MDWIVPRGRLDRGGALVTKSYPWLASVLATVGRAPLSAFYSFPSFVEGGPLHPTFQATRASVVVVLDRIFPMHKRARRSHLRFDCDRIHRFERRHPNRCQIPPRQKRSQRSCLQPHRCSGSWMRRTVGNGDFNSHSFGVHVSEYDPRSIYLQAMISVPAPERVLCAHLNRAAASSPHETAVVQPSSASQY